MTTQALAHHASAKKRKDILRRTIIFLSLLALILLINIPLISMAGTAFKSEKTLLTTTTMLPAIGDWTFENFVGVFSRNSFGNYIKNSAIVSVIATFFCVMFSAMAGYALSRFKGIVFKAFSGLIFLLQIFPGMLTLIPMFVQFSRYGMVNKSSSVIIFFVASNLGFNIMMIRSYFNTLPKELNEAATVDGCSEFMAFVKVIVPISLPGFATIAIMCFLNCWNEFTFSNLLLRKRELQTLTSGLANYVQQNNSNWGLLMAASTIALVPALFFLIFAQKYLVQGLTAGSVKG